jgi:hypothetical protein
MVIERDWGKSFLDDYTLMVSFGQDWMEQIANNKNDSQRVRTNLEDSKLSAGDKTTLVDLLVTELRQGTEDVWRSKHCDRHARPQMSAALPHLLEAYALLLERRARPGLEKHATTFIRHQRRYVKDDNLTV